MPFSPQSFLANIAKNNGPAKPCRFEVFIPIPNTLSSFSGNSLIDEINLALKRGIDEILSTIQTKIGNAISINSGITSSEYLTMQCESAEIPGKTLQTADVKIYGPIFKIPYQSLYSDLSLTFISSNRFIERKLFDVWMQAIMPLDTNNLRFPKDPSSRYLTNIQILQYDDYTKPIHAVECVDAFPIGISSQPLNWGDANFHRMTVMFAYQKYRVLV